MSSELTFKLDNLEISLKGPKDEVLRALADFTSNNGALPQTPTREQEPKSHSFAGRDGEGDHLRSPKQVGLDNEQKVRDCLSAGPMTVREIVIATGINSCSVYNILHRIGAVGVPRTTKWMLRENTSTPVRAPAPTSTRRTKPKTGTASFAEWTDKVVDYLQGKGYVKRREIVAQLGIPQSSLTIVLRDAVRAGKIKSHVRGRYHTA